MPDEAIRDEETPGEEVPAAQAEEDELTRALREREEYLNQWQRARADYQNLKRRTLEDIQAAVRRERTALLEETLTVLDYLDMALASPCTSDDARNLLVGVQMTRDQLWAMLERQGVSPLPAKETFDPEIHQALATVETDSVPAGTVVETVRRGFRMADGVLRYSQVKVAAAPAAGASEADEG